MSGEGFASDHARSKVPAHQTRGWFPLSAVFLAVCIGIPPMVLGSDLAAGMGLQKATVAALWSSIIALPICTLASYVGTSSRLSTGMTLRLAFGTSGAHLISAIIAVDMFFWSALNMELFADSIRGQASAVWSIHVGQSGLLILAGFLMTVATIFGYQSIEKLSFIMVPALSVVVGSYFLYVLRREGLEKVFARPAFGHPIENWTAISVMVGSYLNVSILLPDYTRYSKGPLHSAIAVLLGLCLGLPVFVLIGSYLTAATGEADFVKLMLLQGWGSFVIITVAITCWFHMNACLYSASLNLAAVIPRVPKWKLTALAGICATIVTFIGIVAHYVAFLAIISVLVPPVTGVYTADYTFRRQFYSTGDPGVATGYRPLSVVSLVVGILIGFLTTPRSDMGFGLFHLTRLPSIDSFLASFVCQLVLSAYATRSRSAAVTV